MTTLDTRPADLARKQPAQVAVTTVARRDRPLQDERGIYYARRGGPAGRTVALVLLALLFTALFTGFVLSLIQQS